MLRSSIASLRNIPGVRAAGRAGIGPATTGLLLFLAAWFILAFFFPAYIIPSPVAVFSETTSYLGPDFMQQLSLTLVRVLAGFALAFVLGTAAGIIAYLVRRTQDLNSLMLALEVIPGTILGIIFLLALGLGSVVPIALAALLTLPAVAINTANALNKKNVALEEYLVSAGGGRRELVRYLYLPVLVPTSQSNLSIGFGLARRLVILGEFIGAQDGIGYLLNVARIYFNMKEVFFYLSVVLLIAAIFQAVQSFLFTTCLGKYFYPDAT
jgi:NitT/TauT family transport system permease protein